MLCHTNPATLSPEESIHNVYELHSIERNIHYLYAAEGFPTKSTWIKSFHNGNYLTCPLIKVTNVHKHFPESEETQKVHMQNQRKGLRSNKFRFSQLPMQQRSEATLSLEGKQSDVFLPVYNPKEKFDTYQTEKFPHTSSRGN